MLISRTPQYRTLIALEQQIEEFTGCGLPGHLVGMNRVKSL